jgi:hypothetical protein
MRLRIHGLQMRANKSLSAEDDDGLHETIVE